MASEDPSTSHMEMISQNASKSKDTMRILTRVLQKCDKERKGGLDEIPFENTLQRATRFSGLQDQTVLRLQETEITYNTIVPVDRLTIHNELWNFYFNNKILPTTKTLFNALHTKIPEHVDIREFRKLLVKMGYMWKNIPNYGLVVTEKPGVTFERYNYLKNITLCRKTRRPIFFVIESVITTSSNFNGEYLDLAEIVRTSPALPDCARLDNYEFLTFAVSRTDLHFLVKSDCCGVMPFENWLYEHMKILPTRSVIVLPNMKHNKEELVTLPTENSLKVEMMDWLEYHKVPCDTDMSKSELYSLIENYTKMEKIYKIDNVLRLHGHTVLRIPESVRHLTPGRLIREKIKNIFAETFADQTPLKGSSGLVQILSMLSSSHLNSFDDVIAAEEKQVLNKDISADKVYDRLFHKMNNSDCKGDVDSDLPTLSDSD